MTPASIEAANIGIRNSVRVPDAHHVEASTAKHSKQTPHFSYAFNESPVDKFMPLAEKNTAFIVKQQQLISLRTSDKMERFGGMNILYYHQYFKFPYQAGGTRSFEIASELISRGHNVTMVCSYDKAFSTLKETAKDRYEGAVNGLKIIAFDIPYDNKMGLFKRAVAFAKFALRSASLVFTEKYDLLFATSTPISTAFPGILAKIFRPSKKFVFEIRDPWPDVRLQWV